MRRTINRWVWLGWPAQRQRFPGFHSHCRRFSLSAPHFASVTVKVPPLAESISEGTLASLYKQVGDQVEVDDELASLETDKIDVPVNIPQAGIITQILAAEGDVVSVGQDIAVLETGGEAQETSKSTIPIEKKEHEPSPKPGERVVKLSRMRMAIARNLKQAQNTCASTTTYQDIDMTNLLKWRDEHRAHVSQIHGVRLGYMGAFTMATTRAAAEVPEITATIDTEKNTITYRDYTNIGIAVSTPKGLVTPVLQNTQDLTVVQLEREIAVLATKSRASKLVMEDLEGGHFSISNPGIFGSLYGTPLIPLGQAATFNLNSVRDRVVPVDGKAEIRPQMIVSLTYDHRLIDGLEALKFLNLVKKYIQEPELLTLE